MEAGHLENEPPCYGHTWYIIFYQLIDSFQEPPDKSKDTGLLYIPIHDKELPENGVAWGI